MDTRKASHNPRATDAAPCCCPACRAKLTASGQARIDAWNGYAAAKSCLFALILTGDALAPRYDHGDTLAINADRAAQPGDAVLATFDGNPETRGVMLLNGDGDLTDLRGGYVPRGCFTIAGVVVAAQRAKIALSGTFDTREGR